MDRDGPSTGPTTSDDADDNSDGRFADDVIRDDDSPKANHVLLYLFDDVAPTWACIHFLILFQTLPYGEPDMYILDCLFVGLDSMYYIAL